MTDNKIEIYILIGIVLVLIVIIYNLGKKVDLLSLEEKQANTIPQKSLNSVGFLYSNKNV